MTVVRGRATIRVLKLLLPASRSEDLSEDCSTHFCRLVQLGLGYLVDRGMAEEATRVALISQAISLPKELEHDVAQANAGARLPSPPLFEPSSSSAGSRSLSSSS